MEVVSVIIIGLGIAVFGLGFLGGLINMINIIETAIEEKRRTNFDLDVRIGRLENSLNHMEMWTNSSEEDDRK